MLRGLYTSATAMLAQSRRMDVVTNNLVNVETVGFKSDYMSTRSFADMLISRLNDPSVYQYSYVGNHNLGVHVDQTYTSFTPGALEETNNSTDLAIAGEGFFVVDYIAQSLGRDEETMDEVEAQEMYMRAGSLAVDAEGYLVTANGCYVMGEMGPVNVGTTDFDVSREGVVSVNGEEIDRLRIVAFEDNRVLRKYGDNLYQVYAELDEDGEAMPAAEPVDITGDIRQGFLEGSNVDLARETVRMMETYRSYEINQKMINMFDETLQRTVNDIANI